MPGRDSIIGDGKAGTSGARGGEGDWACCGGERSFGSALPGDGHHCCHCSAVCRGFFVIHQGQMLCAPYTLLSGRNTTRYKLAYAG